MPPLRLKEVGAPSLYLESLRPAIFAGALLANPGGASTHAVTIGGQIDLNFTLAHRLPMTLSAGYASGFLEGGQRSDEILISLKIM